MKTTVIYDHPYSGSLNHEILNRVTKKLENAKKDFQIIDLHKIGFNPVYSVEELALFSKGETTRADIKNYQALLKESDEIIFIFPIWWNYMPPQTKGWIDLVFKSGTAYMEKDNELKPLLTNIKKATIYTTSSQPTQRIIEYFGDPIGTGFIRAVMNNSGIMNCEWVNFEGMGRVSRESITKKLDKIYK